MANMRTVILSRESLPLWFGMLGAPTIWMLQLLLNWSLTEGTCSPNYVGIFSVDVTRLVIIVIAVVSIVVSLASAFTAYRGWQQLSTDPALNTALVEPRRFMALLGILLSVFFLVVIVLTAAPVLVLLCH